ncbi:MAG: hypothetical protein KIT16_18650, partial [Rhodospirillaceae bacterium]|nr:hypothetical protein [Rhodospirillaceae bacterium]
MNSEFDDTPAFHVADASAAAPAAAPEAVPQRPGIVPEKFWDGTAGRVRVEDLAKSYRALERRLGRGPEPASDTDLPPPVAAAEAAFGEDAGPDADMAPAPKAADAEAGMPDTAVPDSPDDYAVQVSHPWLGRDAAIDGLLHAAGFNHAQAQLVYDLAAERVVPVIEAMAAEYERRLAEAQLHAHYGGAERYTAVARQVRAWGQRHLPKPLFDQ